MMIGCTFADLKMTVSAQKCYESMLKNGCDAAEIYGPWDIPQFFEEFNKEIFIQERGCGYWLWKPWIIWATMQRMEDGDILFYSDAGITVVDSLQAVADQMEEDIFFFTNGFKHLEWCKMDCMSLILNHCKYNGDEYKQVQASNIFIRVNDKTRAFVKEWMLWCQMPGLIDDSPSKIPNYETFSEHRHDQAILTCLQIKYGYKLHWFPSTTAEHLRNDTDHYPILFLHHRKRNDEWQS